MTQTLTTEQLLEVIERCKTNEPSPHLLVGIPLARAMATELLANREAQPVDEPYMYELWKFDETAPELERWFLVERSHSKLVASKGQKVVLLYTAPPAPAVPEGMTGSIAMTQYRIKPSNYKQWVKGYNACRSAMLAKPVSQGYRLNSPEIPDGCQWTFDEHDSKWDSGCGEAWMFCDGGPTENGVRFCQSCGKPVLLAAAPEGSN